MTLRKLACLKLVFFPWGGKCYLESNSYFLSFAFQEVSYVINNINIYHHNTVRYQCSIEVINTLKCVKPKFNKFGATTKEAYISTGTYVHVSLIVGNSYRVTNNR